MGNEQAIRKTKQRRVILEELTRLHTHPTADELYERVRKRLPKISLGTVYRNLELLSRQGLVRKLEVGGSQKRFDGDLEKHHHIRCIRCGRIDDLPEGAGITECDEDMIRSTGYQLVDRRVEFLGLCPACRSGGRTEP
jgi:Fur family ferric uptake transcriptional regulator